MSLVQARSCFHLCWRPNRRSWKTEAPGNLLGWASAEDQTEDLGRQVFLETSPDDPGSLRWTLEATTVTISRVSIKMSSWSLFHTLGGLLGGFKGRSESAKATRKLRNHSFTIILFPSRAEEKYIENRPGQESLVASQTTHWEHEHQLIDCLLTNQLM